MRIKEKSKRIMSGTQNLGSGTANWRWALALGQRRGAGSGTASNWLWDSEGELPRVTDFETATEARAEEVTVTCVRSTFLQTHGYPSPELVRGPRRRKTKESDVYALGRSMEQVLRYYVSDCPDMSHPERKQLQDLVEERVQ